MPEPVQAPVAIGEVLDHRYRIERVLGSGGMGVVVSARHVELDEPFAIKFLLPEAMAQPGAVERFLREARAAVRLKNEHATKVHDVGRLPSGVPFMVMDYLVGPDLKSVLRDRGPLPLAEVVDYVLQAAEGLAEAHAIGIVHRDLKPANLVLTTRTNGSPCVKVVDFGISKVSGPSPSAQITTAGMVMGSPLYMSPEQMKSSHTVDHRADIWALGVVLYELATGAVPFDGDSFFMLYKRAAEEPAVPPSKRRPELPAAFDAVVLRCLEKSPEHRFASVIELATALAALEPAVARRSGAWLLEAAMAAPPAPARTEPVLGAAASDGSTGASWGRTTGGSSARAPPVGLGVTALVAIALLTTVLGFVALRWRVASGSVAAPAERGVAAAVEARSAHVRAGLRPGPTPRR